jgi:hypothetical protein
VSCISLLPVFRIEKQAPSRLTPTVHEFANEMQAWRKNTLDTFLLTRRVASEAIRGSWPYTRENCVRATIVAHAALGIKAVRGSLTPAQRRRSKSGVL